MSTISGRKIAHELTVLVNESEYLIPAGKDILSLSSLFLYHVRKNEFSTFMKFKDALSCTINAAAIDIENKIIYIPATKGIVQIDLKAKTSSIPFKIGYSYSLSTIVKNDQLYILHFPTSEHTEDSNCYSALSIYDIASSTATTTDISLPWASNWIRFGEYEKIAVIENIIYIIGGDLGHDVLEYDIMRNYCNVVSGFTLSAQDYYDHDVIVTPDEGYIIVFNAFEKDESEEHCNDDYSADSDELDTQTQILDLESRSCTISPVKLPGFWEGEHIYAMLVDDHYKDDIVNGYLRETWDDEAFKKMQQLPLELIELIIQLFSQKMVYILQNKTGHQWAIHLQELLLCVTCQCAE